MFMILKLAAVTCAFYLAAAVLMQAAAIALAHLRGEFLVYGTRLSCTVVFGIVWLVSFLLAWRVVITPIFAKIPK
jgi:hypothetical protein